MSEMIERVAKAIEATIYISSCDDLCRCLDYRERFKCSNAGKTPENAAREIIAAMREPTLAMLEAATAIDPSRDDYPHASAEAHWPVMIDAALAEEKETA